MAVGTIDDQHIHPFGDQAFGPLELVTRRRPPRPAVSLAYLCRLGKPLHLVDVFDRYQSGQAVIFVNQQKFLDLIYH